MKKNIFTVLLLLCGLSVTAEAQETQKSFKVEVSNTWNKAKADEPVVIKLSEINPQFRVRSAVVMNGSEEIPSQLDDLNGDLRPDELHLSSTCLPRARKAVTVTLSSSQKRQDLSCPCICRDAGKRQARQACPRTFGNHSGNQ